MTRLQEQKAAEQRRKRTLASLTAAFALTTVGLAFAAGATGYVIGKTTGGTEAAATAETGGETAPPATDTVETAPSTTDGGGGGGGGDAEAGAEVFTSAGCGSCHTFTPAGSTGAVGPNLDTITLDEAGILDVVTNGRNAMPSFAGQLDEQQLADVAAYVAKGAGG